MQKLKQKEMVQSQLDPNQQNTSLLHMEIQSSQYQLQGPPQKIQTNKNLGKLLFTSTLSFIFFGLADAGKSLLFMIYYHAGYSSINSASYFVNYFIGLISLLFMDFLFAKLKFSLILYMGAFAQTLVLIGGIFTLYCDSYCEDLFVISSIILPSLLAGLMSTIFYVGYPVYINNLSDSTNRSLFFGIGYSIFSGSMIIGNLVGYFLLPLVGDYLFLIYIMVISSSVQLFYFFVRQNTLKPQKIGLKFQASVTDTLFHIRKVLKIPKFRKLIPIILTYTVLDSSKYQLFPYLIVKIQVQKEEAELSACIMFIMQSLGSVVGGFAGGKLLDIQKSWVEFIWTYLMIGAIFLLQISIYLDQKIILFIGSFSVGLCVNALNVIILSILSNEISQDNIIFTTNNFVQCIGFMISSVVWTICIGNEQLLLCCLFQIFGALSLIFFFRIFRLHFQRNDDIAYLYLDDDGQKK